MPNRVNVNITARDLTRGELARLRRNFANLGDDADRAIGQRSRESFDRLRQSVNRARRDLDGMRGSIPEADFYRMDDAIRRSQRTLQRGFNRVSTAGLTRVAQQVRQVSDDINNLNQRGQIRVRTDLSALRRADAQLAAWRRTQSAHTIRPRVDPEVNHRWLRRLGRVAVAPFRQTASVAGGILSDGIGQGIVQGFQSAGPLGKVIFGGILTTLVAWLGASLGALLITALGAAFVSVGVISAFQSKRIKKEWQETLNSLKDNFEEVGKPLIPVVSHALNMLEGLGDKITPHLVSAFEGAVPATNAFIEKLFEGFERLGKAAFDPIMDAWDVFAPVFGDVFSDFLADVGSNLGDLAGLVREHSYEFEQALRLVFGAVSGIIEVIEFLGRVWVGIVGMMGDAVGGLIKWGILPLAEAALGAFEQILNGADFAFGWIPGVGDSLDVAKRAFGTFKESAIESLQSTADAAFGMDEAIERVNRVRVLKADISKWNSQINAAKEKLKSVPPSKQAALRANIADLQAKVRRARGELASLKDKNVTVRLTTIKEILTYSKTYRSVHDIVGKASGGVIGSAATGGARRGQVLVGEQGPEIVELPGGSRVRSNSDSRRVMNDGAFTGGGSGGGQPVRLMIDAGPSDMSRLLLRLLRQAIRVEGGNVELVLGRNS